MIFKQYKDGSCDILFSKEEITIIKKNKCIHLDSHALKHFGNHLVKIVTDWQSNFDPAVSKLMTYEGQEIFSNKPKK